MFLYNIGIKFYFFFIYVASAFNIKASKAIQGRKNFFKINLPDPTKKYIWFHCASLGEFEQGRPVIERIKKENPEKKILLSFFSPSGFEIRKNYPVVDKVIYLPFDSSSKAKKFFDVFQIEMAVFVKYDVWPFYMREILKRKIPVFLMSSVFRSDQFFFKWYGSFFKKMLQKMNGIFVQNEASVAIAKSHGFENVELSGDTRVDRVLDIKNSNEKLPLIEQFIGEKKCIVFGSVYENEIAFIKQVSVDLKEDFKLIIAPHNVDHSTMQTYKSSIVGSMFFADLKHGGSSEILLVDHVGSLNKIYQYANAVYIGGGYGKGIHNILEPAVYHVPVFFGPNHQKFPEAKELINNHLAFVENDLTNLAKCMVAKVKEKRLEGFECNSKNWFELRCGATDLIYSRLSLFF